MTDATLVMPTTLAPEDVALIEREAGNALRSLYEQVARESLPDCFKGRWSAARAGRSSSSTAASGTHVCKLGRLPKSRSEYWLPKIARNRERDAASNAVLAALGWKVLTIWMRNGCTFRTSKNGHNSMATMVDPHLRLGVRLL